MHYNDTPPTNLGLKKCCGIIYANVPAEELEIIANKLRGHRNVHNINYDCTAEDYNLQFTIIADDYLQLQEVIKSQCTFDIKLRYGYFSILST